MLTIHREKQPDKLIRMGYPPETIASPQPPSETLAQSLGNLAASLGVFQESVADAVKDRSSVSVPAAPPEPVKNQRGRPKKMADKKLDEETGGPETIRKDDPGDQGAIGSGGVNAPAQEKVPEGQGNKEGK